MNKYLEPKEFLEQYNIFLNPQQLEAIKETEGKMLLLAVPGSGKTTVLISRLGYMIAERKIDSSEILTLTFSKAGVKDLKERFTNFFGSDITLPQISTIHSFAYSVIRTCQRMTGRTPFKVLDDRRKIIRKIYQNTNNSFPTENDISDFEAKLTYCKNLMLRQDEIKELFEDDYKILQNYEKFKDSNRLLDFDDMLIYAYRLLKRNPELLKRYQKRFKYIQVDEAQDNSKVQHEIIKLLVGKNGNLLMVADEDQTIYSFRGAYPKGILDFSKEFPNSQIIKMETNYRAPFELIEKANNFIILNQERFKKEMRTARKDGIEPVHEFFKTMEERDNFILASAKKEGKQTAVLFRNNDSAILLVDLLDRSKISFALKESNPTFFSNALIKDILSFYKFSQDPSNLEEFNRIWFKFNLRLSNYDIQNLKKKHKRGNIWDSLENLDLNSWSRRYLDDTKDSFKRLAQATPEEFFEILLEELEYSEYLDYCISNGKKREDSHRKLEILKALAKREKTMKSFFRRLEELRKIMNNPELPLKKDCLTLSTIHSAKGLEFDKVFLIDVVKEVLPSLSNNKDINIRKRELLEEIRIFYVAVTRAKKELEILSIGDKNNQPIGQEVSPFITFYFDPKKTEEELKKIKDNSSNLLL